MVILSQEAWGKGTCDKYNMPYIICTSWISLWFTDIISAVFIHVTQLPIFFRIIYWLAGNCTNATVSVAIMDQIDQHQTTIKQSKARTVGILLGMYLHSIAYIPRCNFSNLIWYFDEYIFIKRSSEVPSDTWILECGCCFEIVGAIHT